MVSLVDNIYNYIYNYIYEVANMNRPKVIFTLDKKIVEELNSISRELNEKKSHIVEKALTIYFDLLDVKIADKRMENLKKGKSKLIPAEDIYKNLD